MATSMSFELREKLEDTLKIADEELQKAQQKGKHYYYRKTKMRTFQPGTNLSCFTAD